jgi:hypothetical protein
VRIFRIMLTAGLAAFSVLVAAGVPAGASNPPQLPSACNNLKLRTPEMKHAKMVAGRQSFENFTSAPFAGPNGTPWADVTMKRTTTFCESTAPDPNGHPAKEVRYLMIVTDDADTGGGHFTTIKGAPSPATQLRTLQDPSHKPPKDGVAEAERMGVMSGQYIDDFDAEAGFNTYNRHAFDKQPFKGNLTRPELWIQAFFGTKNVRITHDADGSWWARTIGCDGLFEEQWTQFVDPVTESVEPDHGDITGKAAGSCSGKPAPKPAPAPGGQGSATPTAGGPPSSGQQVSMGNAGAGPAN